MVVQKCQPKWSVRAVYAEAESRFVYCLASVGYHATVEGAAV